MREKNRNGRYTKEIGKKKEKLWKKAPKGLPSKNQAPMTNLTDLLKTFVLCKQRLRTIPSLSLLTTTLRIQLINVIDYCVPDYLCLSAHSFIF